jgi:putative tricarboxylic transport membrane protein
VKRETVICGFWLLLSLYSSIESHRLGLSTANSPGPGFFPLIAAAGIGVIAALRLIGSVRRSMSAENQDLGIGGEGKLVLYVIAGMTAYAFLLEPLGFFLCTLLLVAFYLKVIAGRGCPVTLIFASAVALTSHIFFDVLLRAELPRGVLDWWM